MRTDSRRDFGRNTVFAEGKAGLLIRSAAHGKGSGIDHPVKRPVRASLDNPGSAILQFRIPIFIRKGYFGFRYMPISIPSFNHVHLFFEPASAPLASSPLPAMASSGDQLIDRTRGLAGFFCFQMLLRDSSFWPNHAIPITNTMT